MSRVLPVVPEEVSAPVHGECAARITTAREAVAAGTPAHRFRQGLFRQRLGPGHGLFQRVLTRSGRGDSGARLRLEDGREVKPLAARARPSRNGLGESRRARFVDGRREGQTLDAIVLEAPLRLPEQCISARIAGDSKTQRHPMASDLDLAARLSSATDVIKGACRCLVKDRVERAGRRWVMAGAQSSLRCAAFR